MAIRPTTIGGAITVEDSTDLALLNPEGLPIGSVVWNADIGFPFKLTVSTAALDPDVVVEVFGVTGSRWIKVTTEIDPGSIALEDIEEIPDQTMLGNVSGVAASPVALTATQVRTLANGWNVVGPTVGDSADLAFASGLDGDSDGDYEVIINLAAVAGTEAFYVRPNNADTGCAVTYIQSTGAVVSTGTDLALFIGNALVGEVPRIHCRIQSSSALPSRFFESVAIRDAGFSMFTVLGGIGAAAGNITSLVLHSGSADGIKAGTVVMWRKLGVPDA